MTGTFYGVGVGPGAPDLLTVRAARILAAADVLCVPRSAAGNDAIALKIARQFARDDAAVLEIETPMTRDRSVLEAAWEKGARRIAARLAAGEHVAFVTIGDAMLYSTYPYLMRKVKALRPEAAVESVPGVTSFAAAAAFLNEALAEGSETLAVTPALDDLAAVRTVLQNFSSVALLKVAGCFDQILDVLEETGRAGQAVLISRLGYEDQLVETDLRAMRGRKLHYLSLILVKRGGF